MPWIVVEEKYRVVGILILFILLFSSFVLGYKIPYLLKSNK